MENVNDGDDAYGNVSENEIWTGIGQIQNLEGKVDLSVGPCLRDLPLELEQDCTPVPLPLRCLVHDELEGRLVVVGEVGQTAAGQSQGP